jgi:hypothetical protein
LIIIGKYEKVIKKIKKKRKEKKKNTPIVLKHNSLHGMLLPNKAKNSPLRQGFFG